MTAYAIAIIRETLFGDDIVKYLQNIDATLKPYEGKYKVHGGPYQSLEGSWSDDLVVIEFPSMDKASAWYNSKAYAAIRDLRINNTRGEVFLVKGVPDGHKGSDILG